MNNKVTFSINFLIIKQNTAEEYKAKNKIKRKKKKKETATQTLQVFWTATFQQVTVKAAYSPLQASF